MPAKHTKESFINRSVSVHGDRYDYSKVEYVNQGAKVVIGCSIHGDFVITPKNHMKNRGCRLCGVRKRVSESRMTIQDFLSRAAMTHGERYDYSESEYKGSHKKIKINCKSHGPFYQTATNHIRGQGCPDCGREGCKITKPLTNEEFIEKSISAHGNKYDYSLVNYKLARVKVKIICQEHGIFEQSPNDHTQGKGCPDCAKTGFDPSKVATLYVLRSECGGLSNWNIKQAKAKAF